MESEEFSDNYENSIIIYESAYDQDSKFSNFEVNEDLTVSWYSLKSDCHTKYKKEESNSGKMSHRKQIEELITSKFIEINNKIEICRQIEQQKQELLMPSSFIKKRFDTGMSFQETTIICLKNNFYKKSEESIVKSIAYVENTGYSLELSKAYIFYGDLLNKKGKYEESLINLINAEDLISSLKDDEYQKELLVEILQKMALINHKLSRITEAEKNLSDALQILEKCSCKSKMHLEIKLILIKLTFLMRDGDLTKAEIFLNDCKALYEKNHSNILLASIKSAESDLLSKLSNFKAAKSILQELYEDENAKVKKDPIEISKL